MVLCPYEGFFELYSRATEGEKGKIWVQNGIFLANFKKFKPLHNLTTTSLKSGRCNFLLILLPQESSHVVV